MTRSRIPDASLTMNPILFGVFLICCFASFSIQFQKDDPNELMYPARLEIKRTRSDHTVEYHFVRPRKLLLEFVLWFQLVIIVLGFIFFGYTIWMKITVNVLVTVLLTFMPAGAVIGLVIGRLIIQVNNATTLSNILANTLNKKDAESWSTHESREGFKQWKELYKTSVGALHVWSWHTTPIMGSGLLLSICIMFGILVQLIAIYTATMTEIDIPAQERFDYFMRDDIGALSVYIPGLLSISLVVLIFISAIARVSAGYKRLDLLIATARLPEHHLDDFLVLQQRKAALTIFDFPITAETTATFLKVFLIQGALLAYTALA